MKRNDWAGGFWAKAAAFLLAVVLVPVLLSYGAALACQLQRRAARRLL